MVAYPTKFQRVLLKIGKVFRTISSVFKGTFVGVSRFGKLIAKFGKYFKFGMTKLA